MYILCDVANVTKYFAFSKCASNYGNTCEISELLSNKTKPEDEEAIWAWNILSFTMEDG